MPSPQSKTAFARRNFPTAGANFTNVAAFLDGLAYPNANLDADVIEDLIINLTGQLTIANDGTLDAGVVDSAPAAMIERVKCKVDGLSLPDLLDIPLKDLNVLTMCGQRNAESDPIETQPSTAKNVASQFSGVYRIPFGALDLQGGDRFFLDIPSLLKRGAAGVSLQFGVTTIEKGLSSKYDAAGTLVGDRTQTAQSIAISFDRNCKTGNPNYQDLNGRFLLARQAMQDVALSGNANTGQAYPLLQQNALLRRVGFYTYIRRGDGSEAPSSSVVTSTSVVKLLVGSQSTPVEVTGGYLRAENLRRYKRTLPVGYYVIDLAPSGKIEDLADWNLNSIPQVKLTIDNAAVTNSYIRPFVELVIPL